MEKDQSHGLRPVVAWTCSTSDLKAAKLELAPIQSTGDRLQS